MTTTPELAPAVAAFSAGRLDDARVWCERVLATAPDHVDALNLAAVIQCCLGRLEDGIALALRVLALAPEDAQALETLGDALHMMEEYQGAAEAFRRAAVAQAANSRIHAKWAAALHRLGQDADAADAYGRACALPDADAGTFVDMAVVLVGLSRNAEAVTALTRAVALTPGHDRAWSLLGEQLTLAGRLDEAVAAYARAAACAPDDATHQFNLGLALFGKRQDQQAANALGRAIALRPDMAEAHSSLSAVLHRLYRFPEAAAAARRAIALAPDSANAHTNLGNVLMEIGEFEDALAAHRRALALVPGAIDTQVNYGLTLQAMGRAAEALAALEQAAAQAPDQARPLFYLALARLRAGDFARGWPGYEARWQTAGLNWDKTALRHPRWDGTPTTGGRVLVSAEQGVGDEVMFAGLLPRLQQRGVNCVLSCDPRLIPLFARSFPDVEMVPRGEAAAVPADVVAQIPAGSLPGLLGLDHGSAPWLAPGYLRTDHTRRDALRARYGAGPVVGLAWRTIAFHARQRRSIALDLLRPLLDLPGLRWVSLQYANAEIRAQAAAHGIVVDDTVDQAVDLDLFAAQVDAMDLVVTIDNATVHMAGALGKPTWALLPYDCDWRWQSGRDDCLWYPNTRLFRQPAPGDWRAVVDRVAAELTRWRTSFVNRPFHESCIP